MPIILNEVLASNYYELLRLIKKFWWAPHNIPVKFIKTSANVKLLFCVMYNYPITTLKSTSVSVCFRGISRLPSALVFLRWFKLVHISIQECTFHDGCKQGIDQQIFNRKSISRKITFELGLRMRNFTWNRFPIKNLLVDSMLTPIVESTLFE